MRDLLVSVPDHCLSFYFLLLNNNKWLAIGNGFVLEWALGLIDYTRSPKWRIVAF